MHILLLKCYYQRELLGDLSVEGRARTISCSTPSSCINRESRESNQIEEKEGFVSIMCSYLINLCASLKQENNPFVLRLQEC